MMETAKKISIAGSSKCENAMNNQTENAKKITKHMKLPKNETSKILPFSLFLSFETAETVKGFASKYETVKMIITSFDFFTNKTSKNETPKDMSNFIVFETVHKTKLTC